MLKNLFGLLGRRSIVRLNKCSMQSIADKISRKSAPALPLSLCQSAPLLPNNIVSAPGAASSSFRRREERIRAISFAWKLALRKTRLRCIMPRHFLINSAQYDPSRPEEDCDHQTVYGLVEEYDIQHNPDQGSFAAEHALPATPPPAWPMLHRGIPLCTSLEFSLKTTWRS